MYKNVLQIFKNTVKRAFCTAANAENEALETADTQRTVYNKKILRSAKLYEYMDGEAHLREVKGYIPSKYFRVTRRNSIDNLYLVDTNIAKSVASHMLPSLKQNKDQLVCETNAGLGLIASELLDNGIELVRLYELCPEFRIGLKEFNDWYPGRVELFVKDLYQLSRMSFIDKNDNGNRVEQLLKGIPKKEWTSDPVMTIVGAMPKTIFLKYLMGMLALQSEIVASGRIQIYALMLPRDYIKLTAGPPMNLRTYQSFSVLFNLFFDHQLLEKYPRRAFLPWETKAKETTYKCYAWTVDVGSMYLVRINLKTQLPVTKENLLPFYYFVKQGFGRGKQKVIPTLEQWLPGCGVNVIVPKIKTKSDINIYTEFGELTPNQILNIFLEFSQHPEFTSSPFMALVDGELLKNETIEDSDGTVPNIGSSKNITEDLQENMD